MSDATERPWRVVLLRQAERYVERLPRTERERLLVALRALQDRPFAADAVPLQGVPGSWRLRIGPYRAEASGGDGRGPKRAVRRPSSDSTVNDHRTAHCCPLRTPHCPLRVRTSVDNLLVFQSHCARRHSGLDVTRSIFQCRAGTAAPGRPPGPWPARGPSRQRWDRWRS